MAELRIPYGGKLLVADGRKALLLVNDGDAELPNLRTEEVLNAPDNPLTHEQVSDRQGRSQQSMQPRRSGVEESDKHVEAERRFAGEVAETLLRWRRDNRLPSLVLVAAPRMLHDLRAAIHDEVKAAITTEIDKDLTKHPVYEIERLLLK